MKNNLTVIFVSYYSEKKLLKYLNQFNNKFNVIIVENSRNFELKKKLKKFSKTSLILNSNNEGFGCSVNQALKQIKTKYALHIDLDTSFSNASIKKLMKYADSIKDFAILTPKIKNFLYKNNYFIKKNIYPNINQMRFVDGCCLLFNIRQFKKIGFFDKNFFLYYEETDLLKRCVDNSKKILMIDNLFIKHTGRSSSNKKYNREIELNRNWHYMWSKFYFHKKHYGYFNALAKIHVHLLSAILKIFLYFFLKNDEKRLIYQHRFSGCFNSILLRRAWYRPKII